MKHTLEQWFFWFFVRKYKVSMLITLFLILYWIFSLWQIPKESAPDIKFGIIWINTIYTWVDPKSIDDLITSKIEKEIKDLEWIKKISSSSSLWISNITVELNTWVDTRALLTDIKDKIDKISFPEDAEEPQVYEISSDNELLFWLFLYSKDKNISTKELYDKRLYLKNYLEWKYWITTIDIKPDTDYEILVWVDKASVENIWLSLAQIANFIKSYNKNTPIWNYEIWDKKYDFRFEWEFKDIEEIKNIPIITPNSNTILLKDIAKISIDYKSKDIINEVWFFQKFWYPYVELTINKRPKISIFNISKNVKSAIDEILLTKEFENFGVEYVNDMAWNIIKDYKDLANNAIQTFVLVFLVLFLFLWLKEWIIATILVPLAFFVTFIALNSFWFTLNFLTNFSLLLTLWIALDTIIVIVEWASEKTKIWYTPKTAVLLTVKEFKAPLIAWNMTTLVVFLPMMMLPWIMWKFLSYIPITVFITLLAWLVLSLTINSALFMKMNKNKKYFINDESSENVKTKEEIELLKEERVWKIEKKLSNSWFRYKLFWYLDNLYYKILKKNIKSAKFRFFVIFTPFILFLLSIFFISPKLGFTLFPATDNTRIDILIESSEWTTSDFMKQYMMSVTNLISKIKEVKVFSLYVEDNKINVAIELFDKIYRDNNWLRNSFQIEKQINKDLAFLKSIWLKIETKVKKKWPPSSPPIWIKLIASSNKDYDTLIKVSSDFEKFLKELPGTKNVWNSSSSTPWQFIFKLNNEKLSYMGLTPNDVLPEIYFMSSWIKAWTIKWLYDEYDIVVKIKESENKNLSPSDIMNFSINTKIWPVKIWTIAEYKFLPSVSSILREDWKIVINVFSDLEDWFYSNQIQPKLLEFASKYNFPKNISYSSGWEASENADLITATISSFFIAIFLIFVILVFQFNSYLQPAIVLYSIILAIVWVNFWLYITWNPYSMPFAIWFIALTWIVVNNAIILIDKINSNLKKWVNKIEAVAESGKSRLRPILLTTLTTTFWVLPLAMKDEFWAWLWYTLIYWLIFSTFLTLFVTPSLYYTLFLRKNR